MGDRIYISVILPLKLDWNPCYHVREEDNVETGDRVRVPFAGKEYTGVVAAVGIEPQTVPSKIRGVLSVEHGLGRVLPEEIEFWNELAEYYMCSPGEVYRTAYPSVRISLEESRLRAEKREQERREKKAGTVARLREKLEARILRKREMLARARKDEVRQRISDELVSLGQQLERYDILMASVQSISGKADIPPVREISLTQPQQVAFDRIIDGFDAGKVVLLAGVTGSGKTEIYSKLASMVISSGRNVLYMVPEIALSRQLEERLKAVFGPRLLTFHSGETNVHRRDVVSGMRRLSSGGGYVVLGTRSSVFLPHVNLGLVIVDEEHDSSYKQDSPAPRYNGRDAAIMLASVHNRARRDETVRCNVVLGSATPSLEAIYNCSCGKFSRVDLKERYYVSEDSEIEIIDTIAERRKRGMVGSFSRKLIDRIRVCLGRGGQVLLLRARRSYSPVMQCLDCGFIPKCPHCNVALSYHKDKGRLVCHYCGHSLEYTDRCPECGGRMEGLGSGTQKIEEEVSSLFPEARVARLDSDVARNKKNEINVIREFSEGRTDILVGTQIVTKGFDFPNLALVAVLQSDTLLGAQDFRADEKAMQLLEQFRGRSGRRGRKGLLVIQTAQPSHPVYVHLAGASDFSSGLLAERRDFCYPPFWRLVNITVRDRNEERARKMAFALASSLGELFPDMTEPYVPGTGRSGDCFLWTIRVSLRRDRELSASKVRLKQCLDSFEATRSYHDHISVDVDPA